MNLKKSTIFKLALAVFVVYLCIYYWPKISGLLGLLLSALTSILLGCCIAFVVNIPMSFYERHFFRKHDGKVIRKLRRPLCMIFAILSVLVVIAAVVTLVVPEFIRCIATLFSQIPAAAKDLSERLSESEWLASVIPEDILNDIASMNWSQYLNKVVDFITSGITDTLNFVVNTVSTVFSVVASIVFGIMFSFYIMAGKERLGRHINELMDVYLKPKWTEKIRYVKDVMNTSFRNYVIGQCMEAFILGALCTIGMLIFNFPYATMIGAMVAMMALIPIIGAYISAIVGAFMILTVSPLKALLFLIFIVVLQQIEGNLIYPRVVGNTVNLPGIWVLAAVTVGGGLFGIPGMIFFVPLTSGIYRMIKEDVKRRELAKAAADGVISGNIDVTSREIPDKNDKEE